MEGNPRARPLSTILERGAIQVGTLQLKRREA